MAVHPVFPRLACWLLACGFPATCMALQTGPPTLENLLNPKSEDLNKDEPIPFENPRAKPVAPPRVDRPRDAPPRALPPAASSKRLAVPDEAAVAEALELIHQAYDEAIQSASANPDAAIRTFRDAANKTTVAGRKYALLLLAERLALEAHATSRALDILAQRAALFDIDALADRHNLLTGVARTDDGRPDALLFEQVVETAELAVAADRFDLADAAADLAEATAKAIDKDEKIRAAESRRKREQPPASVAAKLLSEATSLQKKVRERRRQAFEYAAARDTLTAAPDDAQAAETVGRYLCFVKRDWTAGLPVLARGSDESLRNLAAQEVALAKETAVDPTTLLKLANEWWKVADTTDALPPPQAEAVKAHAAGIYHDIAGKLTDPIDATLARKRSNSPDLPPPPTVNAAAPSATPSLPTLDSVLQSNGL